MTYTRKIPRKEFLVEGAYPIISQEEEFINGYWDEDSDTFKVDTPIVIFGDHTRALKYVDFDFVLGADGVKILKPRNFLLPKFFFYQMQAANLDTLGYARHYKLLKGLQVRYPPRPEQQRIVATLDEAFESIAAAKANAEKSLRNVNVLFQSHLQSIFAGDGKTLDKRHLIELCAVFADSAHRTPKYQVEGIPALRPRDIVNGQLNLSEVARVSDSEYEIQSKRHKPEAGDIVYSRELSYGWAVVLPESPNICLSQGMCIFRPRPEVDANFLRLFLNGPVGREQAKRAAVGAAHPHINLGDIKSYQIELPSLDVQRSIVHQAENAAANSRELEIIYERKLTALDELKKSLLHQAFSGQL